MSQPLTVECPTCGAPVEWKATNLNRPFCSDRCKLIDLGAWAA
ncbi:MAG: DNA gyrase inhibitor YacG, partial [Rhodanobacter sp.]